MAQAVIGALRVNLGLDSAQFTNGMKGARKGLDDFSKKAAVAAAAVAAAATAMAAAFAVGIRKTIDAADEMGKAAQKIGIAVDELSRLKHAADLSGVSFQGLQTSVGRLSRNMLDAAQGIGEGAKAFDALGISVTNADGSMRSSTVVMEEIADRFARMPDGATKTALAMQLMGRSGAEMIPMLNAGAAGLRDLTDEADQLGIVIDQKTSKAAENFNDNLTRLWRVKDGIYTKVAADLLPALETLSKRFLDLVKNGDLVRTVSEKITSAVKFLSHEIGQAAIFVARLKVEIAGLMEALSRLNQYDFSGAWDAFMAGQKESAKLAEDMRREVESLFSGKQDRLTANAGAAGTAAGDEFTAKFKKATSKERLNPFERMVERMRETIAAMEIDAQTFGMATGEAARFAATMDLLRAATEAGLPITEEMTARINELAAAFANATLQNEGARLSLELQNDPMAAFQREIERLNELLAAGAISWEEWKNAGLRAKAALTTNILGLAGQLAGALGQMFGDSKAFAIAEAIINTAQAITKAIATYGPTPWGLAAAGVAAAVGAAQIAAIARTNKGSKTAPSVSGAAGATANDNQPEMRQQSTVIQLHGDVYSRQSVEDLIAELNAAAADGHKIIVHSA